MFSFRNVTSTSTNYMWGGCQRNVIDRYQDYNNEQNIYLLDNVENLSMWRYYDRFWSHKHDNHWDEAPEFKNNLYWGASKPSAFPGDKTWDQWIMGNDTNSLWADPLFTNAEAGDYSLRPGSPAIDLGINQIILGNFGVQEDLRYASSLMNIQ